MSCINGCECDNLNCDNFDDHCKNLDPEEQKILKQIKESFCIAGYDVLQSTVFKGKKFKFKQA